MLVNLMGPNVPWLAEALSHVLDLQPGMRVLDMGCGRAISSIRYNLSYYDTTCTFYR